MEPETFVLTLEKVKECIGFPPESLAHVSLSRLCDLWYKIEKQKYATDEEAAKVVLDKLGDRLLKWGE